MKIDFWDLTSCHLTSYIPCLALTYLLFTLLPLLTHSLRSLVPRVVMRGVRNGPSFFRPITALRRRQSAEPGQGSDRLSLISSVPSLRRVTSFPVTSVRYALRSLRSLSFFACHVIPALRPRGRNRDGTARSLTSPPSLPRPVPFVPHGPSGGYGYRRMKLVQKTEKILIQKLPKDRDKIKKRIQKNDESK